MSDLIAIDPSIVSPGVAVFRNSILIANACIKVKPQDVNDGTRAQIAADAIIAWLYNDGKISAAQPLAIAYEWPQIYEADGPAVANAVISMAAVDAAVTMACRMRYGLQTVHSYKPAEVWGQLPKSKSGSYWKCPRGARIKSRLSELEMTIAVDQHDAGDAVGLGLHSLGRLGLRRVFSNGRD